MRSPEASKLHKKRSVRRRKSTGGYIRTHLGARGLAGVSWLSLPLLVGIVSDSIELPPTIANKDVYKIAIILETHLRLLRSSA